MRMKRTERSTNLEGANWRHANAKIPMLEATTPDDSPKCQMRIRRKQRNSGRFPNKKKISSAITGRWERGGYAEHVLRSRRDLSMFMYLWQQSVTTDVVPGICILGWRIKTDTACAVAVVVLLADYVVGYERTVYLLQVTIKTNLLAELYCEDAKTTHGYHQGRRLTPCLIP